MTITLLIDGNSRSIVFSKKTKKRTTQWPFLDVMASLQLIENSQNPKYDNFVY